MRKAWLIILIILLALGVFLVHQSEPKKSIFTNTVGDMGLIRYETGEVAALQISNIFGLNEIPLRKGYSAEYMGRNGTMRIRVVESDDHNVAFDAFNSMNSKLGASGGHEGHEFSGDVGQTEAHSEINNMNDSQMDFSGAVKVGIFNLMKPDVYMIKENDRYHYYYLKMDYRMGRVFWITFDHPDAGYQKAMVRQVILKI